MNNRIFPLIFATTIGVLSLGCSQISPPISTQTSDMAANNQSEDIEHHQSVDLAWLDYADPKADANLAIERQDLHLLAFAGRVTSFPGIDGESPRLQQQCGYRLLGHSGDTLNSESALNLRKKLYQYAATYNQLIADACQKHNQNN